MADGTDWTLTVTLPLALEGSLEIDVTGEVFKTTTHVYDAVTIAALTVAVKTIVPVLVDYDIPEVYGTGPGQRFDIRLAYNVPVTGLTSGHVQAVFILEGAYLGTPTPYKWVGASPPNIHSSPEPADLSTTDWEIYPAAPTDPTDPDFDDAGFWHGSTTESQYILIRFADISQGVMGAFNFTPRTGILRGPVS